MDTEAKLKYFYDSTMTALKGKGDRELETMKNILEEELENYKKNFDQEIAVQERLHTDEAKRELLKQISGEKLAIRREMSRREEAIKDKLFTEVGEILDAYRETPAYIETLADIVRRIKEFAGDDEVTIWLCPSDAHLQEELEWITGETLPVSDVSFNGGIQAEIPSRNIFINDSFSSYMAEEKSTYQVV